MSETEQFDAVVVGAGPSGSITSYFLSRKGLKVALVDKKDINKDKICGGGVSNYALQELPFSLPKNIIEQRIKGVRFIAPNNDLFMKKESHYLGVTVYRNVFDGYLLEKSIDSGTVFYPNNAVKHITKENNSYIVDRKFKAKYLVGADGANSIIKKTFGIGPKQNTKLVSLRLFYAVQKKNKENIAFDPECLNFYFLDKLKGYNWIFPLKDAFNVGLYSIDANPSSKLLLQKFLLKNFQGSRFKNIKIEGFPIPIAKLPKHFSRNNVFMTGDAAGLIDPVTGEGIHYAIRSGKIVADTILKDQELSLDEKAEDYYKLQLQKDIIPDLMLSYKLKNFLDLFFGKNISLMFKIIKRNPFIFNYIEEIAIKNSYYDIYKDILNNIIMILLHTLKGDTIVPELSITENLIQYF